MGGVLDPALHPTSGRERAPQAQREFEEQPAPPWGTPGLLKGWEQSQNCRRRQGLGSGCRPALPPSTPKPGNWQGTPGW